MNYIYKLHETTESGKTELVYIGATIGLKARLATHEKINRNTVRIEYTEIESGADMEILEIWLINKYAPKYNKKSKYTGIAGKIDLSEYEKELTWLDYKVPRKMRDQLEMLEIKEKYDTTKKIKKRRASGMAYAIKGYEDGDIIATKLDFHELMKKIITTGERTSATIYTLDNLTYIEQGSNKTNLEQMITDGKTTWVLTISSLKKYSN